jgi:DNA mismatch endonuclease (patch repair protein)
MQAIRSTKTKIEVVLGKELWSRGYRYRRNNKTVFGKPDFTFKKLKLAIFCDSEFWHGKDWDVLNRRLQTNREFWIEKIERNIARDIKVNEELKKHGWTVLRFWEKDIKKNLDSVVASIEDTISSLQP